MARKRKAPQKPSGPLQRLIDQSANEERAAPLVNEFAEQHGDYDRNLRFVQNRNVNPIARWKKEGLISQHQEAAIDHCITLWQKVTSSGRLVANLDRTVFGCAGEGNVAEIEARSDLHRIKAGFPDRYWDVFENVCRFDEPAGVAGSSLAEDDSTRRAMARAIVCMVADIIYMRERLSY